MRVNSRVVELSLGASYHDKLSMPIMSSHLFYERISPHFTVKRTRVRNLNFSVVLQLTKRCNLDLHLDRSDPRARGLWAAFCCVSGAQNLASGRLHSVFVERGRWSYPHVPNYERIETAGPTPAGKGTEAALACLLPCDPGGLGMMVIVVAQSH